LFSLSNLFIAWREFRRGKTGKKDAMDFEMHLEDNIFSLYRRLNNGSYKHSPYTYFQVFDNKKRDIYKAQIEDRVVHQVIYEYLLGIFEKQFIVDSYASRIHKGQSRAVKTFRYFIKLVSGHDGNGSNVGGCYVLKCDIKKYFDAVDQVILLDILSDRMLDNILDKRPDEKVVSIIKEIINSYSSKYGVGKGIPLGNVTSQIFANIYLNELDQYVKKELRCRCYVRYNDDFVIISKNAKRLEEIRRKVITFTSQRLNLEIPFEKTSIRKIGWGIDFLGFTVLSNAMLLRDKTKNKIYGNISDKSMDSYMGILKQCNSHNLSKKVVYEYERRNGSTEYY